MVEFVSDKTRGRAEQGLNAVLARHLPGADTREKKRGGAAAIAQVRKNMDHWDANRHVAARERLKTDKKRNAAIRKAKETERRVEKLAKLQAGDIEEVENAIAENVRKVKSWEPSNAKELRQLELKIIRLRNKEISRRKKVRQSKLKKDQFQAKVKKGLISVPGLTPGLAPVGETGSSDDEVELDGDDVQLKDDYDEYN
ncbi:hypothetical protein KL930_001615 [Ogataea haglerorum]|uniref:Regulator of rDNA transcription 14 n=1 Tax=Ogataea haglerorum TaxID=1937702 RepID=A0ABQ7RKM4_9ASCO|nr:uncharacterized protein KL911_001558 [Ogataea haglerorum]KAG7697953.1 hypothetical protein KL915_001670 [Ogataea haglerorum]KAG7699752.1 hypothetical protein KL951_001469 [Ogataea haglerorum]KAG7708176.1 hypothetical protein KL914_001902 [Ogataea haglerorum]KAG7710797.1 hypothetical protein KL950_001710 [Ogataea haglerorum]KAG7721416.1 hypothetical protein KL913_001152 [Ogataea haglerorum]